MNCEQSKNISLENILERVGLTPVKRKGSDLWYISPFRREEHPSFHICTSRNIWYDFGEMEGGDQVAFVRVYLKHHGLPASMQDALRWLKHTGFIPFPAELLLRDIEIHPETEKALELRLIGPLMDKSLLRYLARRGIPAAISKKYLRELDIYNKNTKKKFKALGLKNVDGGYELHTAFLKSSIGTKDITFIRGSDDMPKELHVFEAMMDFFSVLAFEGVEQLAGDTIVLNSVNNLRRAKPYIQNYHYTIVHSWMDNDEAGEQAKLLIEAIVEHDISNPEIQHWPRNEIYAPHKDVNAWHVKNYKKPKH